MVLVNIKTFCLALVACLAATGCGVYSFSGSLSSGIESVAVPIFENKTVEYGIAEELTSGIVDGFVADNTLKVVPRSKADAVLNGIIVRYERVAYTYDENDQVQEYKVTITASARLLKTNGDVIWEGESLSGYGIYKAEGETEEEGKTRAIAKIAEDIINRTVKAW